MLCPWCSPLQRIFHRSSTLCLSRVSCPFRRVGSDGPRQPWSSLSVKLHHQSKSAGSQIFSFGRSYLNTGVANPYAGMVPGSLGAATITRANLLKSFPITPACTKAMHARSHTMATIYCGCDTPCHKWSAAHRGKLKDVLIFDLLLNTPGADTKSVNGPQNWRDPSGGYSVDVQDVTHRVTISACTIYHLGPARSFSLVALLVTVY